MKLNAVQPHRSNTLNAGVRSVLFFALVRSLPYQEGKLILDGCAHWQVQMCVSSLQRERELQVGS